MSLALFSAVTFWEVLRGLRPTKHFFLIFDIFAYSEKTQKKNIFDINLSLIEPSQAPRDAKKLNTVEHG